MTTVCGICVKNYTDHVRKPITCPSCQSICCKECLIKYFKTSAKLKCMFCDVESFTPEFLIKSCRSFHEITREITKKALYDSEAELFNSTRNLANMYKSIETHTDKEFFLNNLPNVTKEEGILANVMRQCPVATCNGHYMLGDYRCGTCKLMICKSCGEIETGTHVCEPNVLESLAAIDRFTKNCPKCGVSIEKIDGCDQMFCTDCKTAFDWVTLKVINSGIENPHYFEWIRSLNEGIPRDQNDIPCGGVPTYQDVFRANEAFLQNTGIDRKTGTYNLNAMTIVSFQIYIDEIHEMIIPALRTELDNTDLRIKFMCGEIDKPSFTTAILKRHNKKLKSDRELEIFTLIRDAGADIIQRWTRERIFFEIQKLQSVVAEIDALIHCANMGFARVCEINASKLKRLHKKIENIGHLSKYSAGHYRVHFVIQERDSM